MLQETHIQQLEASEYKAKILKLGLSSFWTGASVTGFGGTHGGTSVLVDQRIKATHMSAKPGTRDHLPDNLPYQNFTPVVVSFGRLRLVVVSVYLRVGIGLEGENQRVLGDIAAWLSLVSLPWIVLGDWNVEPAVVRDSPWLTFVRGKVVTPSNTSFTCTSGQEGRLLDYGVCSEDLEHQIISMVAVVSPWKPHMTLVLRIKADKGQVMVRRLATPRSTQVERITRVDLEQRVSVGPITKDHALWKVSEGIALQRKKQEVARGIMEQLPNRLDQVQTRRLGAKYAELITTAEIFHARTAEVGKERPGELEKYIGRAKGTIFAVKDRMLEPRKNKGLPTNSCFPMVQWWAMLTSRLGLLVKLRRRTPAEKQVSNLVKEIVGAIVTIPEGNDGKYYASYAWQAVPSREKWKESLRDIGSKGTGILETMEQEANVMHKRSVNMKLKEARQGFLAWIAEHSKPEKSHAAIFGWIKKRLPPPASAVWTEEGVIVEPLEVLQHRKEQWEEYWCRDKTRITIAVKRMEEIKDMAEREELEPITIEGLNEALYSFKDGTAKGLDGTGPRFWKRLPEVGRQSVVELLNDIEKYKTWPWQLMGQLVVLLGKPTGGERPIALLQFFLRLWLRCRRPLTRQWAKSQVAHWDHALANSSALRSATLQKLRVELADLEGIPWGLLLWDLTKFYDTVALGALIQHTVKRKYPATVTCLVVATYLSPRVIRQDECYSEWIYPVDGILPGCGEACNMARNALYGIVEEVTSASPRCTVGQFVDDVKQYAAEDTVASVVSTLAPAAIAFLRGVKAADLLVSKKSVVLASDPMVATILRGVAHQEGVELKIVTRAVDLGVDIGSTNKRTVSKLKERMSKAGDTNSKVEKLQVRDVKVKMHTAAVMPQATYGCFAVGIAPTGLGVLRRQLAAHCGHAAGMCTTTLLELEVRHMDPKVAVPERVLLEYIGLWLRETDLRKDIEKGWQRVLTNILNANSKGEKGLWQQVKGPVANTICTLIDMGWVPESSTKWVDSRSSIAWELGDQGADMRPLVHAIRQTIRRGLWMDAAGHHLGEGVKEGVDLTAARKLIQRYRGKDDKRARMVVLIATAGMWTEERAKRAGYITGGECLLCNKKVEDTVFHTVWECQAVLDAGLEEVMATEGMAMHAKLASKVDREVFWSRGLVPWKWMNIEPEPEEACIVTWGPGHEEKMAEGNLCTTELTCYLDESGGVHARDVRIRRSGWGLAFLNKPKGNMEEDIRLVALVAGSLAGLVQTPNRAAIEALLYALKNTSGNLTIMPDSKYLVKGAEKGEGFGDGNGVNADLWSCIGVELRRRRSKGDIIQVLKTKAHQDVRQVCDTGDYQLMVDLIGNSYADEAAGQGASLDQVEFQTETNVSWYTARAGKVLARAATVYQWALERMPVRKRRGRVEPGDARTGLERKIVASEHVLNLRAQEHPTLESLPAKVECIRCKQSCAKIAIYKWLGEPCKPVEYSRGGTGVARAKKGTKIQVGNSELHGSHSLNSKRGVWWCSRCGHYTTTGAKDSRPKKLKERCPGQANGYGKACISRIKRGLPPCAHRGWPEQEVTVSEGSRFKVRTKVTEAKGIEESSPEEQEEASSSKGPAASNEPEETGQQLNCQGAGEEYEQGLFWEGLDEYG